MKRTFLGIVAAINPTETSSYSVGRHEVTIVAHSAELGGCNSTFKPSLTHEETRQLGALFGKPNAVRITIETDVTPEQWPTCDDAKLGEYYEHGDGNVYRRSPKGREHDVIVAEAYSENGDIPVKGSKPGDYTEACRDNGRRIAALLNGEHAAVALLKEVIAFADTKEMLHDHTGAVNWLLDFSRRPDVMAVAGST